MSYTIEEQEARAYQSGNLALAAALAQLADARTEIDTLRALVGDAIEYVKDGYWQQQASKALAD